MKNTILVQPFTCKYQKQVLDLILNIQREEFNISITADDQPDLKDIPNFYHKGCGNFWIALDPDQVVGTVALVDIGNQEVALRKMFVNKDYRGKGVSKKLLEVLVTWAKEKYSKTIYLGTTPAFLAAHRFYEKNGFVEISKEALPKNFPVMAVDKKFYRLEIH